MLKLVAAGIAGAALGAAATSGAVAPHVVVLHVGDIAPVAGTHVFCKIESRSLLPPRTGPAVECGETKQGVPGSYGIGITDDAAYVGRWNREEKRITTVVFSRLHHH